jgi:hypothetical protein
MPKHPLTYLHHLQQLRFSVLPPALKPVYPRQVVQTCQRKWMLISMNPPTYLLYFQKQLFGFLPPALSWYVIVYASRDLRTWT